LENEQTLNEEEQEFYDDNEEEGDNYDSQSQPQNAFQDD